MAWPRLAICSVPKCELALLAKISEPVVVPPTPIVTPLLLWIVRAPLKVLLPAKVWAVVFTRPGKLALADCRNKVLPLILAPLALAVPPSKAPIKLTAVLTAADVQLEPFQRKLELVPVPIVTPAIVKLWVPILKM